MSNSTIKSANDKNKYTSEQRKLRAAILKPLRQLESKLVHLQKLPRANANQAKSALNKTKEFTKLHKEIDVHKDILRLEDCVLDLKERINGAIKSYKVWLKETKEIADGNSTPSKSSYMNVEDKVNEENTSEDTNEDAVSEDTNLEEESPIISSGSNLSPSSLYLFDSPKLQENEKIGLPEGNSQVGGKTYSSQTLQEHDVNDPLGLRDDQDSQASTNVDDTACSKLSQNHEDIGDCHEEEEVSKAFSPNVLLSEDVIDDGSEKMDSRHDAKNGTANCSPLDSSDDIVDGFHKSSEDEMLPSNDMEPLEPPSSAMVVEEKVFEQGNSCALIASSKLVEDNLQCVIEINGEDGPDIEINLEPQDMGKEDNDSFVKVATMEEENDESFVVSKENGKEREFKDGEEEIREQEGIKEGLNEDAIGTSIEDVETLIDNLPWKISSPLLEGPLGTNLRKFEEEELKLLKVCMEIESKNAFLPERIVAPEDNERIFFDKETKEQISEFHKTQFAARFEDEEEALEEVNAAEANIREAALGEDEPVSELSMMEGILKPRRRSSYLESIKRKAMEEQLGLNKDFPATNSDSFTIEEQLPVQECKKFTEVHPLEDLKPMPKGGESCSSREKGSIVAENISITNSSQTCFISGSIESGDSSCVVQSGNILDNSCDGNIIGLNEETSSDCSFVQQSTSFNSSCIEETEEGTSSLDSMPLVNQKKAVKKGFFAWFGNILCSDTSNESLVKENGNINRYYRDRNMKSSLTDFQSIADDALQKITMSNSGRIFNIRNCTNWFFPEALPNTQSIVINTNASEELESRLGQMELEFERQKLKKDSLFQLVVTVVWAFLLGYVVYNLFFRSGARHIPPAT